MKSSAVVGFYTLLSRILGFFRDVLFAALLGAGPIADAFYVAFRFPNYFRQFFAEGAFSAVFVPKFSHMMTAKGLREALLFAEQTMSVLSLILILFTIVVELFMPQFLFLLAPGFKLAGGEFELAVYFAHWMFPYLFMISITALYGGILNSMGKFAAFAATPILMNICFIGAILTLHNQMATPGHAAMVGAIISGVVQMVFMIWVAKLNGVGMKLRRPKLTPEIRQIMRLAVPAALASGLLQINLLVDTLLASFLGSGAVSYLWYADRMVQLPVGVVGVAIGTALLPLLSRQVKAGQEKEFNHNQNRALEMVWFMALPAMVILMVLADPLIHVLFERGVFDGSDTSSTAGALAALAAGLPAYMTVRVFNPAFFARQDTKTPFRIGLAGLLVNIVANLILMQYYGFVGIAAATALASWTNTSLSAYVLWRRGHLQLTKDLQRKLTGMGIAAGGMAVALGFVLLQFSPFMFEGLFLKILGLGGLLGIAGAVYIAMALLCGGIDMAELKDLAARILRRKKVKG